MSKQKSATQRERKLTRSQLLRLTTLILIAVIWPGAFHPVATQRPAEPLWRDFAVLSVETTPLALGAGDLVVFDAKVQVLQTNMGALASSVSNSSISMIVTPTSLPLGKSVTIKGTISPPHDATVFLRYIHTQLTPFTAVLKSERDGTFAYTVRPDAPGSWEFSVSWAGDADHLGAESVAVTVHVEEAPPAPSPGPLKLLEGVTIDVLNVVAMVLLIVLLLALLAALTVVGI